MPPKTTHSNVTGSTRNRKRAQPEFKRTIPHGDGSYNQLPDGTYISEKGGDISEIRSQISNYADRLSIYRASVFVCEFSQCAWYLYRAKA
ncbi:hypothetical protein EA576_21855 [Salmonella enterica subsp. enterica serovar Give]|nr:hypothetical protein [Salmonella enterica subsp. enterica serovar Give]EAP4124014.1 hypothetical protein [Salmonella enterica subsp. enterica serovar Infantis]EAR0341222.1 hypothetical protein [Salmonella enterica subsp. enterica serovar Anatum]EAA8522163.1 hypothetical protein [Salmonella enterica subsp. enterica serovar Give]EAA8836362.1 hypothetical protein [Salmonella enterica subsp. enterica serovar Give]